MLGNIVKKIVGSSNDRTVKKLGREVDAINSLESSLEALSDEQLAAKTPELRERLAGGAELASVLPEAFAITREARDNMAHSVEQKVQRELNFAIVDEVDSILIDEARTPLIISGPADGDSALYLTLNAVVPKLERQQEEEGAGDYSVSDGLHQAVEAKEGVEIQRENQTLASITYQNYFRLYDKLAGMTGTADTEAFEFQQIYGLEVVVIPTHRPMVRDDRADLVFLTQREKYDAIIEDVEECVEKGQPVLVGTTSVETSEYLAGLLKEKNIPHEVLNAKQHEREASIIENAGRSGAVTIATNMAGRGTDIVLGGSLEAELAAVGAAEPKAATALVNDGIGADTGAEVAQDVGLDAGRIDSIKSDWKKRHDEVLASGGLHIIGTERHESRRIDNQLRGRSGRQGDPGSTRFYLSLEDSLMRIFASDRVSNLMQKLGMQEGEAIEHPWVTKAIENAQRKVEGHNFDIRKHLLEYDDVANDQRKVVYEQRDELMVSDEAQTQVAELREEIVPNIVGQFVPPGSIEEHWDLPGLEEELKSMTGVEFPVASWLEENPDMPEEEFSERIVTSLSEAYDIKEEAAGAEGLRRFEKYVMLQALDEHWKEHLAGMDYLRQSVGLRGYAQKNPKQEYKREAFELFTNMLDEYKTAVFQVLSKVQVRDRDEAAEAEAQARAQRAASQPTDVTPPRWVAMIPVIADQARNSRTVTAS